MDEPSVLKHQKPKFIYTDFWPNFDDHHNMHIRNPREFWPVFMKTSDLHNIDTVEISTVFGKTKPKPALSLEHGRTLRVCWSGESYIRDTKNYDVNFVMRETDFHERVICLSLLQYTLLDNPFLLTSTRPNEPKTQFCVFVVTNGSCAVRNRMFELLNSYRKVDSCGKFNNNTGELAPINSPDKNEYPLFSWASKYKFMICFENTSIPEYLTEKLYYAWKAGTVPIYWGATAPSWLNQKAFIHLQSDDTLAMQKVVEQVMYLDTHDDAYWDMQKESLFLTTFPQWNISTMLQDRHYSNIEHIFVICNRRHEPLHYRHMRKQFRVLGIPSRYVTYWSPTYGVLTEEQQSEFGIQTNLSMGEVSLCYNFFSLAKQIIASWDNGHFLVLEADACFLPLANAFFRDFVPTNADLYNIGTGETGVGSVVDSSKPSEGVQSSIPQWGARSEVRCTEAIIWSRTGLERLLQKSSQITLPLDWHINSFLKTGDLTQWCSYPPYVEQGSKNGLFRSTLEAGRRELVDQDEIEMDSEEEDVQETPAQTTPPDHTNDLVTVVSVVVSLCVVLLIVMIILLVKL